MKVSILKAGTKAALAFAVSMTLFLNAAHASSAVTLTSPNAQNPGYFGLSVAISGTTAVVGASLETGGGYYGAGHAYIIDITTDPLTFTLTSPNAETSGGFGFSVAISGTMVVVGAPGETAGGHAAAGHAYVFDITSGSLLATLTSPSAVQNGEFGFSVAVICTTVVVGAPQETSGVKGRAGNAYVFDGTSGSLLTTLTSPNAEPYGDFGRSVAINDGDPTVVVGAPGETAGGYGAAGNAYVFDAASGSLLSTLTTTNAVQFGAFGTSVAITGTTVVVGAPGETVSLNALAGHAYVFDGTLGSLLTTLTSPNAVNGGNFGMSVAINDGDPTVVVGAPGETVSLLGGAGHAYTFDASTGTLIDTFTSPYAQLGGDFGRSVAITGTTVVVGAPFETAVGQIFAGHAYVF